MRIYFFLASLAMLCITCNFVQAQDNTDVNLFHELKNIEARYAPDKRVAIFEIEIREMPGLMILKGKTNLPEVKNAIHQLTLTNTYTCIDSVTLLPNSQLVHPTWALASLSVSNIRATPSHKSELLTQAILGTPLKILESKGSWYRVQTPDLYIGWMDNAGLHPITANELNLWKQSKRYVILPLQTQLLSAPKLKSAVVSDLVMTNILVYEGERGPFLKLKMPDGRIGYIQKKQCEAFDQWVQQTPTTENAIAVAHQLMGVPYLWGANTSKALDCSGLVKMVFFSEGILLDRDASQQALQGEAVDIQNINNLQAGDLIFFGTSAQNINHVAIYLHHGQYIHASGRVFIGSLNPHDPHYDPSRNLVAARRIINSLNTHEGAYIKNNDWYIAVPNSNN